MPQIRLTVRGAPDDHVLLSEPMTEEEASEQFESIRGYIGTTEVPNLPWVTVQGENIITAEIVK